MGVAEPRDLPLKRSRMADARIGAPLRGIEKTQKLLTDSRVGFRKLPTRIGQGIRKTFSKGSKKSGRELVGGDGEGPPAVSGPAEPKESKGPNSLEQQGKNPREKEACSEINTVKKEKRERQRLFR